MMSAPASSTTVVVVLLLCGLPASGKSTIARRLCHPYEDDDDTDNDDRSGNVGCSNPLAGFQMKWLEYDQLVDSLMEKNRNGKATTTTTAASTSAVTTSFLESSSVKENSSSYCRTKPFSGNTNSDDSLLRAWKESRSLALSELKQELHRRRQQKQQQIPKLERCNHLCSDKDEEVQHVGPSNCVIVMDDNFHLGSMRKQIYQICQQSLVSDVEANDSIDRQRDDNNHQEPNSEIRQNKFVLLYGIVVVDTPVELCLERNRRRPAERQVPDRVILKMDQSWEAPTKTTTTFNRVESFSSSSETPPPAAAAAAVENAEPTKTATAAPSAGRSAIIEFCRADDTVREYPLLKLDGRGGGGGGGGDGDDDSKQLNNNVDLVRAFITDLVSLSSSSPPPPSSAALSPTAAATCRAIAVRMPVDPNLERDRIEKEQNQTAKSYIHQADQTLRHCVKSVATLSLID